MTDAPQPYPSDRPEQWPAGAVDPGFGGQIPRPKDVDTAFLLWIASMVVSVIAGIIEFATLGPDLLAEVGRQLEAAGTPIDPATMETIVSIGAVVGLVITLGLYAVWLLFILKMRAGRNWARIVLTVLGGLDVIFLLIGFTGGLLAITTILEVALVIGAIVFMFRPAASTYFTAPLPPSAAGWQPGHQ